MDNGTLHVESLKAFDILSRVAHDAILSITYLRVNEAVAKRRAANPDPSPLSADTVVGQVVEHVVQTVATQNSVLGLYLAIDIEARLIMEIECSITQGQRSRTVYTYATINDNRFLTLHDAVTTDDGIVPRYSIPGKAPQRHPLLYATL